MHISASPGPETEQAHDIFHILTCTFLSHSKNHQYFRGLTINNILRFASGQVYLSCPHLHMENLV